MIFLYTVLALLVVSTANAEKYFVLDVNYISNSITFNSINLREIDRAIKYEEKSGFMVKTVSFENTDIKRVYYNMSENKNYLIYIPYNKNTARIEMYNPKNSKIMDIDVSSFADTCGNKICEPYESYEICPNDCPSGSKDDFCDKVNDGICDPDCSLKTDADCIEKEDNETVAIQNIKEQEEKQQKQAEFTEKVEEPNYLIWALPIFGIVVFILLLLFIKKRKENQIINSLKLYINDSIKRGFTLQQIKDALFREGYSQKEVDKAIKFT